MKDHFNWLCLVVLISPTLPSLLERILLICGTTLLVIPSGFAAPEVLSAINGRPKLPIREC